MVHNVQRETRLSPSDTDFLAAGGPESYAWNVLRAESDDLMLQHARKCGVNVFEGVKVNEINFKPMSSVSDDSSDILSTGNHGRPVSASWSSGLHATSGTLSFGYIVDASGRAGLLNKYTKNRRYTKGLNNVASWGYWHNTGEYAPGTVRANSPYFEALSGVSSQLQPPA